MFKWHFSVVKLHVLLYVNGVIILLHKPEKLIMIFNVEAWF